MNTVMVCGREGSLGKRKATGRSFMEEVQWFSLTLNQMHVVVFSESVFHVEHLLYPPEISSSAFSCVVLCLLGPYWSPGHSNIKAKKVKVGYLLDSVLKEVDKPNQ